MARTLLPPPPKKELAVVAVLALGVVFSAILSALIISLFFFQYRLYSRASGQTRTPHPAPYRSDTLWSIGQTMPAQTACAHCRTIGFVRWEYVITGTTSRTIYY